MESDLAKKLAGTAYLSLKKSWQCGEQNKSLTVKIVK